MLSAFILHEIVVLLVDRVIREMHVFIVFVELDRVGFRGKSGQAFFVYIDSEGLVACDDHVDSEVKFIAVNQKRIGDISRDDAQLIDIQVIDVIDNVDPSSPGGVAGVRVHVVFNSSRFLATIS